MLRIHNTLSLLLLLLASCFKQPDIPLPIHETEFEPPVVKTINPDSIPHFSVTDSGEGRRPVGHLYLFNRTEPRLRPDSLLIEPPKIVTAGKPALVEDTFHISLPLSNTDKSYISEGKKLKERSGKEETGDRERIYALHEISLATPTCFYLFTDGFQDQFGGEQGKKYMLKNLHEFLLSIHTLSMDEQREALDREIERWKGTVEQVDDICIFGVKI